MVLAGSVQYGGKVQWSEWPGISDRVGRLPLISGWWEYETEAEVGVTISAHSKGFTPSI